MIKNGNYHFLDFDKYKPQFIEAFTRYYGEEYRNKITSKINQISYHGYNSQEYMYVYYSELISRYYDEILDKFIARTRPDKKAEIDILLSRENKSLLNGFYNCVYLDYRDVDIDEYIECRNFRNIFNRIFNIKGNAKQKQEKLENLYRIYYSCVEEVRKEHHCDVFEDIDRINKNSKNNIKEYLEYIESRGVEISDKDKEIINSPNYQHFDIPKLEANSIFFEGSIDKPGSAVFFNSNSEKMLNTHNKLDYIVMAERLKYLMSLGVELKYITNIQDLIDENNDKNLSQNRLLLNKEYKYQKKINGHLFIDREVADSIEARRQYYIIKNANDCKYFANITNKVSFIDENKSSQYYYQNGYKNGVRGYNTKNISFCEDDFYTNLIRNLIHEVSHAVSDSNCVEEKELPNVSKLMFKLFPNKYSCVQKGYLKNSFSIKPVEIVGSYIINDIYEESLEQTNENINDRLSKDITDIFLSMYDDVFEKDDIDIDREYFYSVYEYADFITEDFYRIYKDNIKKSNMEEDYFMFNPQQTIDSKASPSGILDYNALLELDELINSYQKYTETLPEGSIPITLEEILENSENYPVELEYYLASKEILKNLMKYNPVAIEDKEIDM